MTSSTVMRLWLVAATVLLLLPATASAQPPAAPYLNAAPPPGLARIWFFRDLNPNETQAMAYIRLNGTVAGVSEAGGAFYRDVAPGRYHISVDSYVEDPHNEADVVLAPGMEAYARVVPFDDIVQGGGGRGGGGGGYRRNTFVVWLYPPEVGRAAVAHSYFTAGGS
jgi:hypothetical protein